MATRVFCHDYPNNPYIDALYTSGNVRSRYKIIALGHYPQNVKYTQKSRSAIQYQIPDGYIVKMEAASKNVRCEMKYIPINKLNLHKVLYTITWKEGRAEYSISSERSASEAINAFLKMLSESEDPVHLRNMELEYEDHIINIKYNLSLDHTKLDAYVRACDEALLGHDGYRRLAAIEA
ncbi:hypothetical protein C1645_740222 [Glomus cerebriforme]|uniref:Uncharacterized protein n=1 Tax=Glomus cerebriforme TaxID=658196 RepID=A0A397SNQ4_9GLOM|nr:hypothetical protein C1645_740222 [Glomus cerebriforme]